MSEIWKRVDCAWCGEPFEDEDDWFDRHNGPDCEDVHARCCTECNPFPSNS